MPHVPTHSPEHAPRHEEVAPSIGSLDNESV
nr:MAG TPA: hypothetical protein [Caudoviricetes sp.]